MMRVAQPSEHMAFDSSSNCSEGVDLPDGHQLHLRSFNVPSTNRPYAQAMEYRRFGRTEMDVSIVGLGTGGASRLGLAYGATDDEARSVVRRGFDLGINYFDTAENYRNEHILGDVLSSHRNEVVISSKVGPVLADLSFRSAEGLRRSVEQSLTNLKTDFIDVYHLHRLTERSHDHGITVLVPQMVKLQEEGKIRYLAVSESSGSDVEHKMLRRALNDKVWDVIMTSFNLFNQSARTRVFSKAIEDDIAVEIMASARSQFSRPEFLAEKLQRLVEAEEVDSQVVNIADPLDFLRADGQEISAAEASYRFAAHEPGVHVVLVGTGNIAHLEENVAALNRGPLPREIHGRIVGTFGHLMEEVHVPGRESGPF